MGTAVRNRALLELPLLTCLAPPFFFFFLEEGGGEGAVTLQAGDLGVSPLRKGDGMPNCLLAMRAITSWDRHLISIACPYGTLPAFSHPPAYHSPFCYEYRKRQRTPCSIIMGMNLVSPIPSRQTAKEAAASLNTMRKRKKVDFEGIWAACQI